MRFYSSMMLGQNSLKPDSWANIQKMVRAGRANEFFNIGDQLTVMRGNTPITFDIIGIDHDTPADPNLTHSMTLQTHNIWDSENYSVPQATWYIDESTYPNGLVAGTYNFSIISGYESDYGGGKTYMFTLTKPVPVGGQVRFNWATSTQASACKIVTYVSVGGSSIESVSVSEGSDGTALPTPAKSTVTANTNCWERSRRGNDNWSQSAMRQLINSSATTNKWWTPQSVFDRPVSSSLAGFLNGLDPKFLNVVGYVNKTTQKSISDGYGLQTSQERIFLPSRAEVYAGTERSADGADGTVYAYYGVGRSSLNAPGTGNDANRIALQGSTARQWGLRTAYNTDGYRIRAVNATGGVTIAYSTNNTYIRPCCCIV